MTCILSADWVLLRNITNINYCPIYKIDKNHKFDIINPNTNEIWNIIDSDMPFINALLLIPRKNIFLYFLYGDIRITENLIKYLLIAYYQKLNYIKLI